MHTQQAHSTTPLEAPHSAGSALAASGPPSQSSTSAPPVTAPPGIQHALVSKSVSLSLNVHATF
jgi:C-terminal binding protein